MLLRSTFSTKKDILLLAVLANQNSNWLSSIRDPPSEEDWKTFFQKISKAEAKPAILKITMPYAEEFVPRLSKTQFPIPITELYNPKMLGSDYIELLSECEKAFQDL